MNFDPRPAVFALAVMAWGACAWAESADRNRPMSIEADTLRYDDQKQTTVFTGRVVLTKGSIILRGARLEVRQDPQGNQYGTVSAGPDAPAFFRQKREGVDEFIEGEADTIHYDGKADTVTFTQRAQLRRYRGTSLGDEVSGAVIVYDNLRDRFSVDGTLLGPPASGAAATGSSGTGSGRVRAMLIPKPEAASSTAPVPPVMLRPSDTLGGAAK
jgi:lipopolysaccharide export system protein LptA